MFNEIATFISIEIRKWPRNNKISLPVAVSSSVRREINVKVKTKFSPHLHRVYLQKDLNFLLGIYGWLSSRKCF